MKRSGANTTGQIKKQEPFSAPHIFQYFSKHPQRKHVKQDVPKAGGAMTEHVRHYLVRTEQWKTNRPKADIERQIAKDQLCYKYQHIYDDQVFYNRWEIIRFIVSEIAHLTFFLTEQHF